MDGEGIGIWCARRQRCWWEEDGRREGLLHGKVCTTCCRRSCNTGGDTQKRFTGHHADIVSSFPTPSNCSIFTLAARFITPLQQILSGQKVTVVRCEEINISGSFFRNKLKYHAYLHSAYRSLFVAVGCREA